MSGNSAMSCLSWLFQDDFCKALGSTLHRHSFPPAQLFETGEDQHQVHRHAVAGSVSTVALPLVYPTTEESPCARSPPWRKWVWASFGYFEARASRPRVAWECSSTNGRTESLEWPRPARHRKPHLLGDSALLPVECLEHPSLLLRTIEWTIVLRVIRTVRSSSRLMSICIQAVLLGICNLRCG